MTPEPRKRNERLGLVSNTWRDLVQNGADSEQIDGFALEYLIDLQRNQSRASGEGR